MVAKQNSKGLLIRKFKELLIKTVGEPPDLDKYRLIDREIKKITSILDSDHQSAKAKIYYDKHLSKLWKYLVAFQNNGEEIITLVDNVEIRKGALVTSMASGVGVFESFIAKELVPDGKCVCVDLSDEMCRQTSFIACKAFVHNIKVLNRNVKDTGLKFKSQDLILARRTGLTTKPIWPLVLDEVDRILKNNKKARFVYTSLADICPPVRMINKAISRANLKVIKKTYFNERVNKKIAMVITGR